MNAVVADMCVADVAVRTTAPSEAYRTVDDFASLTHALVAINGDYFDTSTHLPLGVARGDGQWWNISQRMHRDALFVAGAGALPSILFAVPGVDDLWNDAMTRVPSWASSVVAAREQVLHLGVVQTSPRIPTHDGRHPRTGIGLSADGRSLILLVVDGRTQHSVGATARELGVALRSLGASEGLKLDGGGSSTLVVQSFGVVNHPSDGQSRVVANHVALVAVPHANAVSTQPVCRVATSSHHVVGNISNPRA